MAINNNPNDQNNQPGSGVPLANDAQSGRAGRTGTGFTNLSRVLNANKNNQLASTVAGGVNNQVNAAKTGIQSGLSTFQTDAQKNNIATDANKSTATNLINNAQNATDDDAKQFETFRSGRYDGPTELANKQQLTNQAQQASTLGQMAGSTEGRQGLLQRFAGGAGYTQGKQRLDSLLLGQGSNAGLKDAYRDARGLNQQVNTANLSAEEMAKAIAGGNQQFATDTKTQLGNGINGIYDTTSGRMNDWTTDQTNLINGITDAGKYVQGQDVTLTKAQADALAKGGLDLDKDQYLYNTNLGDVITKSGFNPSINSAIETDEAAKAKGLARLFGTDNTEKGKNLVAAISDPTQYGTLKDASKIDANQTQLDQLKTKAQEDLLRDYYNNVVRSTTTMTPWEEASDDQFLDRIKNEGYSSAYSDPYGRAAQGYVDNQANDLYGSYGGLYDQNASSDSDLDILQQQYGAGGGSAGRTAAHDALNTGGAFDTKSNLEKAIDALRAKDLANGTTNKTAITQAGQWGNFDPNKALVTTGNYNDTTNGDGGFLTGVGAENKAAQYGRLRKLLIGS